MATQYNGNAGFVYFPSVGLRNSHSITSYQRLKAVNQPAVYQVYVDDNNKGLDYQPVNAGDVVNVVFQIMASGNYSLAGAGNSRVIAEIRKAADIPFEYGSNDFTNYTNFPLNGNLNKRIFTVDISNIIKTRLSYGLIPVGRGTFNTEIIQGHLGTGLSGVYGPNIQSPVGQGCQQVKVKAYFEVLNADGEIEIARLNNGNIQYVYENNNITGTSGYPTFYVNAVRQHDERQDLNQYIVRSTRSARNDKFLSMCPNGSNDSSFTSPKYLKKIRLDERQEALYWFQFQIQKSTQGLTTFAGANAQQSACKDMFIYVETLQSNGTNNTAKLNTNQDFMWWSIGNWQDTPNNFGPGEPRGVSEYPAAWLAQNVSPDYINNSTVGTPINSDTLQYRVSLRWEDCENGSCSQAGGGPNLNCNNCLITPGNVWTGTEYRSTEYRYFVIDHSSENAPFPYIRIHWLNSLGGIDSYTFKRNKTETISRKISTYERKPNDPSWGLEKYGPAVNDVMIDDTWGTWQINWGLQIGTDQYKQNTDVLSVEAQVTGTVYSEPLNKEDSKWLSEIMKSPNVWMEVENDRADRNAYINSAVYGGYDMYTTNKDYQPIIVQDGEMMLVDEENRLVQFQLQYRKANNEITQRN